MDKLDLTGWRRGADFQQIESSNAANERHRNWHVSSLGADLIEYGLTGFDADAMMGLRSVAVAQFHVLLSNAIPRSIGEASIGDLLMTIIDQNRGDLEPLGRQAAWDRRWRRYHADLARWRAQPASVKEGRWREKPMTAGQRALVQITATALGASIPLDLTRGSAADWLDARGANLSYRSER
jgi:hypothetical protein